MATIDSVQPTETTSDQAGLKDCQWFVMSPRTSLESSTSRPQCEAVEEEQDENAVPNTAPDRSAVKGAFAAPKTKTLGARVGQASPNSGRHSGRQQPLSARREQQALPCMRQPGQSTSPRTSRKSLGETSRSPGRMLRGTPSRSTQATPEPSVVGDESGYEPSFASMSMYSEMSQHSCSSRLTQLSRRSFSHRHLSSAEMLQQEVEDKKRDLAKLRKQNDINCRKARQPDVNFGTLGKMTTKVTMPKEFHLSAPMTPRLKESRSQSDNEDSVSTPRSARRLSHGKAKGMSRSSSAGTAAGLSSTTKWAPQLTVPRGPICADPEQVKLRRSVSCPPEDFETADEQSVGTCLSARSTNTCLSARGSRTSADPPQRPSTPERASQGVPSKAAAAAERRRSRSEQQATPSVRPATPERRVQAARPATPDRSAQPVRRPTPERSSQPVRRSTPERRSEAAAQSTAASAKDNTSEARAERARQQAMLRNQEQAAKRNQHCIFRKSQAASSQVEDADAPPSARAAPTSARTTPLRERLNHSSSGSIGTGAETDKAVKRRPSFGSTARRPCC